VDSPGWTDARIAEAFDGRRLDGRREAHVIAMRAGGGRLAELVRRQEQINAWSIDVTRTRRGVGGQMKIKDARCKLKSIYPKLKLGQSSTERLVAP